MPSKIAVHKPAEPQNVTHRRPVQVPLADKAALKPPLRTPLELNQLAHRLRTAPETVSSREFNLLSGVIGLRSALMLLDQGKRTKSEQAEQTRAKADKPSLPELGSKKRLKSSLHQSSKNRIRPGPSMPSGKPHSRKPSGEGSQRSSLP